MTAIIGTAIACTLLGLLGGYVTGWSVGVRETEQRWSDAVAKADYDRKYRNR